MRQAYEPIPVDVIFYLLEKNLSKPAMRLYLLLRAYRNNGNGNAWIGRARIIKEAHIHKDDVKRARDELETSGLINIQYRSGKTPLVSFNDDVVPNRGTSTYDRPLPNKGTSTSPEKGDYTPPEKGDTTITNTNTNNTNTNPTVANEPTMTNTMGSHSVPAERPGKGNRDDKVKMLYMPEIQNALKEHFELTPNWKTKWNQEFLQWIVAEGITPEQIATAADNWNNDGRYSWRPPSLEAIRTSWLSLNKQANGYTGAISGV